MDELLILVEVYKPHIIGITESQGSSDITDSELSIACFNLFRRDRPTTHKGGGVLLQAYVSDELEAVEWKSQSQFPEQVWCKLKVNSKDELLVGVCYRTVNKEIFGGSTDDQLLELQYVSYRENM